MTKKQTNKNTKVYVRFRPANELENDSNPWDVNDKRNYSCEVCEENEERARNKINVNDSYKIRTYTFDRAFSRYDSQVNVYRCTTSSLINNLLNGKNSSLMCYGQTGSGKTYTLFGFDERRKANDDKIDENDGIVARAVDDLFWKIRQTEKPGEVEYQIEVQFIQIYNEKVHDMLVPHQVDLPVRMVEEPLTGNLDWSAAATFVPVRNTYELMTQVQKGLKNRAVRLTSMNQSSSRSHAILKIRCRKLEINSGSVYTSVFDFVDLAGSEKVSNSLVLGAGFKEASYINVSLLHVKNVIKALSLLKKNKERPRVIYRNSVLTKLLYQTLGGNSESALILCASPHVYNLRETISTLRFGTMAKNVTSKPKVNYVMSIEELRKSNAVCIKRLEQQAIAIERKKKDVERNKILMFQILTKLNQNSQTYKEIKRRFGHWFPNLPENRVWGNLLLPEVVFGKIFEYTGVYSLAKCVTVCKDWKSFLLDDNNVVCNYLWRHVAANEGFVSKHEAEKKQEEDESSTKQGQTVDIKKNGGYFRKIVCDNLVEKFRKLREQNIAKFAEDIKKLRGTNATKYSSIRLIV